jgi:O-antigen chain-terminating methyltransferase
MGRYRPEQLIRGIERVLSDEPAAAPPNESVAPPPIDPGEVPIPDSVELIRRTVLPELYRHAAVNKVPPGSRLALLKKGILAAFRPLTGRQSAFNFETCRAIEVLTEEVVTNAFRDAQTRAALAEIRSGQRDLLARLETADRRHNELALRTEDLAAQLETLAAQLEALAENIVLPTERIEELDDRIATVAHRLDDATAVSRRADTELQQALQTERGLREEHDAALHDLRRNIDLVKAGLAQVESLRRDETLPELQRLQTRLGTLEGRLREAEARLTFALEFRSEVLERLEATPLASAANAPVTAPPAQATDQLDPIAYLQFQRQFRGDEELLRARQTEYVARLERHLRLGTDAPFRSLDLACGEGVLVGILRAHGWDAHGVDINPAMTRLAGERGLSVATGDAFDHLRACEPRSWDVISALQFVEHLSAGQLSELVRLAHRALRPGGLLLIETLNPNTLLAHKWFHLDLTHRHLVFPQVMGLLCETAGLVPVETHGIHPPEPHERLDLSGAEDANANLVRLNDLLFGAQDYYLIARKPGGGQP